MNLEQLIRNCVKGNVESQSILYQRYKDTLFSISLKYCLTREEARDNLQDSFLEIFGTIKKFKNTGSFEGCMKRITIYKAIDKYKKSIRTNTIIHEDNLSGKNRDK